MKDSFSNRLRTAICLGDFLNATYPVDISLLGKMILAKSIGMIAGPRGSGKSWLALLIAYAISCKKQLIPWGDGAGVGVAILDGEMRAIGLQERLALLHDSNTKPETAAVAESNLHIISRDCVGDTIGSIDTEEGQARIDALIPSSVRFIVIDNLSAWTKGGREDGDSWATVKNWLIKMRLKGIAVLLIHHAGKNGQQRGSSSHEDLLDYSILLGTLPSTAERQDTRFSIEHTKLRDFIPELRQTYEGSIWTTDGKLAFEFVPAGFRPSEHEIDMLRMHGEGMSMEDIGREFNVSKSTVSRTLKKLRDSSADIAGGESA